MIIIQPTMSIIKMWTLPFVICKSLACEANSLRLISKRSVFKTNLQRGHFEIGASKSKADGKNLTTNSDVKLAAKLINKYTKPENIQWDELLNELKDSQVQNVRSVVLQSCWKLVNAKAGLSFYNYLVEKGEKLTVRDCVFFSKLFLSEKHIIEDENLVKNLYDNMKNHMMENPMILEFVLQLVAKTPSCFFDVLEKSQGKVSASGKELILVKALDYDCFGLMLEILNNYQPLFNRNFITAYFNYLNRMVKKHQFSPSLVTILTDICEKKISTLACSDLLSILKTFTKTVNQHQNDYYWSAINCQISGENVCSNCGFHLVDKPISDAEFKILKENCFLKIGLLNKNVFLSSTEKEFQKFLHFLDNCKPYNVVLDFLNIFNQVKHFKVEALDLMLQKLVNRGLKVLIITRKHMKKTILNNYLCNYKTKGNVQCFFIENTSDDDVFLLYAAMHNGPGTYILSRDYYTHYIPHIDPQYKNLFLKWKIYHQFIVKNRDIMPPTPHLGVPQLTSTPDKNRTKFVWHFSHKSDNSSSRLNCEEVLNWICLEAVKKPEMMKISEN